MECEYCIGAGKVAMGKRLNNGKLSITIVRCKRCNGTGKKLTNADRIRAMSDEELADVIANGVGCVLKAPHCMDDDCTPCILWWLKQPVEEE